MAVLKQEQIRDRMVKSAARLWGIQENEIESSFDPLILLMIDACAAELEKIGYEISSSQSRLLDRLAEAVLPESITGPKPAFVMMQAFPFKLSAVINSSVDFYTSLTFENEKGKHLSRDIHFAPIGEFVLHQVEIAYLFSGNTLYSYNDQGTREIAFIDDRVTASTDIWIALSVEEDVESIRGLSLYFNQVSHSKANLFYSALQLSQGFIDGADCGLANGFYKNEQFDLSLYEMLESGTDHLRKYCRQTAFVFQNRFKHFSRDISLQERTFPEKLENLLPGELVKKMKTRPLVFVNIQLNRPFSQEMFDGLHCSVNAFPVINLKSNMVSYRTDNYVTIIPLLSEDLFFDLISVTGIASGEFKFRPSAGVQELQAGEALLITSGIGKTSSREVKELTSLLMDAVRDQSAYFQDVSNEFILSSLREINQILAALEDRLSSSLENTPVHHYLLLRSRREGERVLVDYLTTNGPEGNHVKGGVSFSCSNHSLLKPGKIISISNAVGGSMAPDDRQRKALLRQPLISGGKIVSAIDIQLLCRQLFGKRLHKVEIGKGVMVSSHKEEGVQRSIDVHLTFHAFDENVKQELDELCRELEYELSTHGSPVYPYRVIINNTQNAI